METKAIQILFQNIVSNFTKILFYAAVLFGAYFLYKNYNQIVTWFKNKASNIATSETPTSADLKNSSYVIDKKVISNYVDILYSSMADMGTDEFKMDSVYHNLLNSNKENTIAVWNEWKNRGYKYRRQDGTINPLLGMGETLNLYQVMQSELTNNLSERNALLNWTSLFKRHGLI